MLKTCTGAPAAVRLPGVEGELLLVMHWRGPSREPVLLLHLRPRIEWSSG